MKGKHKWEESNMVGVNDWPMCLSTKVHFREKLTFLRQTIRLPPRVNTAQRLNGQQIEREISNAKRSFELHKECGDQSPWNNSQELAEL